MGYDAHITRARQWTESISHPVSEAEWRACVADDPELEFVDTVSEWRGHPSGTSVCFDHRDGEVVVKNPDEVTLAKMIAIARTLGAHVEGDDGERYESPGFAIEPEPPRESVMFFDRIFAWVAWKSERPPDPADAPFRAGDRIKDAWNHAGRIVSVDMTAERGLGLIRVRFDDGREVDVSPIAHGLERID